MEQRGARNRRAEGAAFGGRHVNFLHLKYFLMVAEELNITRAAERLYISQQSLSNHISNMERELNVKLFTRSPKLSLTYAGDQLVLTATQILELHSQYLNKVGDINRHYMGVLRVGISYTCGLAVLPEILPQFRREFPMVEFSMFEGNSTQLEDELSHGRVDLIICFQPIMLEGIRTVPLTEQKLVMVVPKVFTDQLFGEQAETMREQFSKGADISAFQKLPFVLIKRGNRTRSIVDQYFSRYYFKPKLILETENTVTTLAMAQAGVGITICPELFLRAIPAASASPTPEPTPTFTPVDGVSDGVEYTSYGDHVVVTGYEGAAEDILAIPEEIDGLPVTAIGDEAFRGQSAMGSVIIPGSVEEVGDLAFAGCTSLRMVFARRDMEIGGGVFEGCDELRALFKTSDFDTDLADWGFSANVVSFAIGQDTGAGALVIIYVTDDGVVYGVTEDECAVVLDIPAGLGTVTLSDSVGDYPVVWMYAGALENADSDVEVYLADGMGFPYEIRNDANWAFKDDCGPDSFCFNWYLSCYLAEETNDRRPDGAVEVVPVREYVEAAIQRSEEIYSTYQHERPDGRKFSTIFGEFGIEIRYTTQWIDHFPVDDLEAELLDCAESLVEKSESYGVYYTYMGAATYYGGDEVYLCRLAGADDQDG